jgi:hypothetical protein
MVACVRWLAPLVASITLSCAGTNQEAQSAFSGPAPIVRIRLSTALIAPVKSDGRAWDATPSIAAAEVQRLIATAAGPDAHVAFDVVGVALREAGEAFSKPDVTGFASVRHANGLEERRQLLGQADSFTPIFDATWREVVLTPTTSLTMDLMDSDLSTDDPIGHIVLTSRDLLDALRENGKTFPVSVTGQTAQQVLFVGVNVETEAPPDAERQAFAR